MQTKEAKRLKERWGNKPCNHPEIEKEYDLGAQTGDYVCTVCGEEVDPAERAPTNGNRKE